MESWIHRLKVLTETESCSEFRLSEDEAAHTKYVQLTVFS